MPRVLRPGENTRNFRASTSPLRLGLIRQGGAMQAGPAALRQADMLNRPPRQQAAGVTAPTSPQGGGGAWQQSGARNTPSNGRYYQSGSLWHTRTPQAPPASIVPGTPTGFYEPNEGPADDYQNQLQQASRPRPPRSQDSQANRDRRGGDQGGVNTSGRGLSPTDLSYLSTLPQPGQEQSAPAGAEWLSTRAEVGDTTWNTFSEGAGTAYDHYGIPFARWLQDAGYRITTAGDVYDSEGQRVGRIGDTEGTIAEMFNQWGDSIESRGGRRPKRINAPPTHEERLAQLQNEMLGDAPQFDRGPLDRANQLALAELKRSQGLVLQRASEGGARAGISPDQMLGRTSDIGMQGGMEGARLTAQNELQVYAQKWGAEMEFWRTRKDAVTALFQTEVDEQARKDLAVMQNIAQQREIAARERLLRIQADLESEIDFGDIATLGLGFGLAAL